MSFASSMESRSYLNSASSGGTYPSSNKGTSSGLTGMQGAAIGISTLSNIMAGQANTKAFKDKLKAQREADFFNAGNVVEAYELQATQNAAAIDNINSVLGDKMSERGLTALKEFAMLKAASAETGTYGGTSDMAINEAWLNEQMDYANIISDSRQQRGNILNAIDSSGLQVRNQVDSMLLGSASVSTDSTAAILSGGLSGLSSGLSLMTKNQQSNFWGTNNDN